VLSVLSVCGRLPELLAKIAGRSTDSYCHTIDHEGGMTSWVIYDTSSRCGMGIASGDYTTSLRGGAKVMLWQLMGGVYIEIKFMQWA